MPMPRRTTGGGGGGEEGEEAGSEPSEEPSRGGTAAVLFGHSHVPNYYTRRGVLYFNPGSCGPRRFNLPVTVGLLEVDGAEFIPRIIELV